MSVIPCWSEMSFDEMADYQRYSVAATRKIRGTYNKIQKIAAEWNIDRYQPPCNVPRNISFFPV